MKWMIDIGYKTGYSHRESHQRSLDEELEPDYWKAFAKHLIVVTDRPAIIGNLLSLCRNRRCVAPTYRPHPTKSAYRCVVESLMVSISLAVATFERVTILYKHRIDIGPQWKSTEWPPHKLAVIGSYTSDLPVHMTDARESQISVVVRSLEIVGSVYQHATFTYDWDDL